MKPTGLGSELNDICGKDWGFGGGDHGDPGNFLRVSHGYIILCLVTSMPYQGQNRWPSDRGFDYISNHIVLPCKTMPLFCLGLWLVVIGT